MIYKKEDYKSFREPFFKLLSLGLFTALSSVALASEPKTLDGGDDEHHRRLSPSFRASYTSNVLGHDFGADLHDLMEKLHFSGVVCVKNKLKTQASIEIVSILSPRDDHHNNNGDTGCTPSILDIIKRKITQVEEALHIKQRDDISPVVAQIAPGFSAVIKDFKPHKGTYIHINMPSKARLNINLASANLFKLTIDNEQRPIYPQMVPNFNFMPVCFETLQQMPMWAQNNPDPIKYLCPNHPIRNPRDTLQFEEEFDTHVRTMAYIISPQEGVKDVREIFQKRAALWNACNFNLLCCLPTDLKATSKPKIPLITHKFWLTSSDKPMECPTRYIEWARQSMRHMPIGEGWKHYLWVQHKSLLPGTVSALRDLPITILELYNDRECTELNTDALALFEAQGAFEAALDKKKFGMASDICRLAVLKQYGGIYYDTDYIVRQNPYLMMFWLDSFFGIEPMSTFLCNALMAAKPNHPIINRAIANIIRNFDPGKAPTYIRTILASPKPDHGWLTVAATGPVVTTMAFHAAAGQDGNIDVAFPPSVLYPGKFQDMYPQKEIRRNAEPLYQESLGDHEWEGAWTPNSDAGQISGSLG